MRASSGTCSARRAAPEASAKSRARAALRRRESVHVQREVMEGASLRVSYVYKNLRRLDGEVDLGRVGAFTVPFSFVDAGPDNRVGTADDQRLNLLPTEHRAPYPIASGPILARMSAPRDDADYQTLELAFNRSTRNNWMLTTSFSHTWAKEFTNVNARTGVRDSQATSRRFTGTPTSASSAVTSLTTGTSRPLAATARGGAFRRPPRIGCSADITGRAASASCSPRRAARRSRLQPFRTTARRPPASSMCASRRR